MKYHYFLLLIFFNNFSNNPNFEKFLYQNASNEIHSFVNNLNSGQKQKGLLIQDPWNNGSDYLIREIKNQIELDTIIITNSIISQLEDVSIKSLIQKIEQLLGSKKNKPTLLVLQHLWPLVESDKNTHVRVFLEYVKELLTRPNVFLLYTTSNYRVYDFLVRVFNGNCILLYNPNKQQVYKLIEKMTPSCTTEIQTFISNLFGNWSYIDIYGFLNTISDKSCEQIEKRLLDYRQLHPPKKSFYQNHKKSIGTCFDFVFVISFLIFFYNSPVEPS